MLRVCLDVSANEDFVGHLEDTRAHVLKETAERLCARKGLGMKDYRAILLTEMHAHSY